MRPDVLAGRPAPIKAAPRPLLARIDNLLCRIIGAPDYDKYVAHQQKHHPDDEPLSRKDFECRAYSDRYSRPGSRCC